MFHNFKVFSNKPNCGFHNICNTSRLSNTTSSVTPTSGSALPTTFSNQNSPVLCYTASKPNSCASSTRHSFTCAGYTPDCGSTCKW